jgi:hypothetical protein
LKEPLSPIKDLKSLIEPPVQFQTWFFTCQDSQFLILKFFSRQVSFQSGFSLTYVCRVQNWKFLATSIVQLIKKWPSTWLNQEKRKELAYLRHVPKVITTFLMPPPPPFNIKKKITTDIFSQTNKMFNPNWNYF